MTIISSRVFGGLVAGSVKEHTLYLNEPSTGLRYAGIDLLFAILEKLNVKNDILIIDHNPYLLGKIGKGVVLG